MRSDIRFAIRTLRQRPGYTIAAIVALALGVAANTSIFSIAEGLLYRPLPLPEIDRILVIEGGQEGHFETIGVSPADLMELRERSTTIDRITGYTWWSANVSGVGFPERVQAYRVTTSFFQTLGVDARLGRLFNDADHLAGSGRIVILSEGLWERKFARDTKVLGATIRLSGEPFTIVGIAPANARIPSDAEIWTPVAMDGRFRTNSTHAWYHLLGRLKPGVSAAAAQAEMRGLSQRIAVDRPNTNAGRDLRAYLLRERISGQLTADYTRLTQLAALLLLLIASSNVANLMFAIVSGRAREIALRQALGAGRWAIVRQLLAESLLLGAASVPVALLLTLWSLDWNKHQMPAEVEAYLPGWRTIGIDQHALLFGIAVALLGSLIAGILPAWLGSRTDLNAHLREGGRSLAGSGRRGSARTILVVVQVTLSMVLITGAALMQRGTSVLLSAAPGHANGEVLAGEVDLPESKYPSASTRCEFAQRLVEKTRSLGGVSSAALIFDIPFHGNWSTTTLETSADKGVERSKLPEAGLQIASPGYFGLMGIPILKGRDLADSDTLDSQPVAVVSELLARRFFSDDAIGKQLRVDKNGAWVTIVGVSADVLQDWILRQPQPTVYRPYRQVGPNRIGILIRASGSRTPNGLAPEWRTAVMQLDPELPLFHVMSFERMIQNDIVGLNYMVAMLGASGVLSLLLAAVGIYSLMSFTVEERTRELGIRMALGARPGEIIQMIVGNGLSMVLTGLLIGTAASLAVSRLFANLIFGVPAFDPVSLALGAGTLALGAALASYVPARWASRADPVETLRHD
jgi:putative ABC transport system permease protein